MKAQQAQDITNTINDRLDTDNYKHIIEKITSSASSGNYTVGITSIRENTIAALKKDGYKVIVDPDPRDYGYTISWK